MNRCKSNIKIRKSDLNSNGSIKLNRMQALEIQSVNQHYIKKKLTRL